MNRDVVFSVEVNNREFVIYACICGISIRLLDSLV